MSTEQSPYTPGPWTVAGNGSGVAFHVYSSADRAANGTGNIATVHAPMVGGQLANARLIAAAPALLAALESALERFRTMREDDCEDAAYMLTSSPQQAFEDGLRAALAAAQGGAK